MKSTRTFMAATLAASLLAGLFSGTAKASVRLDESPAGRDTVACSLYYNFSGKDVNVYLMSEEKPVNDPEYPPLALIETIKDDGAVCIRRIIDAGEGNQWGITTPADIYKPYRMGSAVALDPDTELMGTLFRNAMIDGYAKLGVPIMQDGKPVLNKAYRYFESATGPVMPGESQSYANLNSEPTELGWCDMYGGLDSNRINAAPVSTLWLKMLPEDTLEGTVTALGAPVKMVYGRAWGFRFERTLDRLLPNTKVYYTPTEQRLLGYGTEDGLCVIELPEKGFPFISIVTSDRTSQFVR